MSDLDFILWTASLLVLGLAVGTALGYFIQLKFDADDAISDDPSFQWRAALIDAQARKQKKGLK